MCITHTFPPFMYHPYIYSLPTKHFNKFALTQNKRNTKYKEMGKNQPKRTKKRINFDICYLISIYLLLYRVILINMIV